MNTFSLICLLGQSDFYIRVSHARGVAVDSVKFSLTNGQLVKVCGQIFLLSNSMFVLHCFRLAEVNVILLFLSVGGMLWSVQLTGLTFHGAVNRTGLIFDSAVNLLT